MTTADRLLQQIAQTPADDTLRAATADAVRDEGQWELADVVESPAGVGLLQRAALLAVQAGLPLTLYLLWAAHNLVPRMPTPIASPAIPHPTPNPDPAPEPHYDSRWWDGPTRRWSDTSNHPLAWPNEDFPLSIAD